MSRKAQRIGKTQTPSALEEEEESLKRQDEADPFAGFEIPANSVFGTVPVRSVNHASSNARDGNQLCRLNLLVLSTRDETVTHRDESKHTKVRITGLVLDVVAQGAPDVLTTGVDGTALLFPSVVTGERVDGNRTYKTREVSFSGSEPVHQLSTFSASFYKKGMTGGPGGGGVELTDAARCRPGMVVTVLGVNCSKGSTKDGDPTLYLNASRVDIGSSAAPVPHTLSDRMMEHATDWALAERTAFFCSIGAGGFFNASNLTPEQTQQALVCSQKWEALHRGVVSGVQAIAAGKSYEISAALNSRGEQIRSTQASEFVTDENFFMKLAANKPIVALVQKDLTPTDVTPYFLRQLALGGEAAKKVPNSFVMSKLVDTAIKGNLVTLDYQLAFCFDKAAATAALRDNKTPFPYMGMPTISINVSLPKFAVKNLGTKLKSKGTMGVNELLPVLDYAVFPKVTPLVNSGASFTLNSEWPEGEGLFVNMASTLGRCAVPVTEKYVQEHLCDGDTQYSPDEMVAKEGFDVVDDEFEKITETAPTLGTHHVQELSGSQFTFKKLNSVSKEFTGKELKYAVVYDGMLEHARANADLVTSPVKAELWLEEQAANPPGPPSGGSVARGPKTAGAFLKEDCLVYAFLV